MSQPTPYTPNADFSQQEANNASGRSTVNTAALDAEFAAIETTLDQTLNNIQLLQRDDGRLGDLLVEIRCLSQDVLNVMGGFNLRGLWVAATAYAVNDICSNGAYTYVCKTAHISGGSFSATNWIQFGFTSGADAAQSAADAQASRDSAIVSKDAAALSAANAAISAGSATTSATNAANSAYVAAEKSGSASSSATSASNSAAAAAASAASISGGAGSGLDADLLDGQHGSYYAPVLNPSFYGMASSGGSRSSSQWSSAQFMAYTNVSSTVDFASTAYHVNDASYAPQWGYNYGDSNRFGLYGPNGLTRLFTFPTFGIGNGLLKIVSGDVTVAAAGADFATPADVAAAKSVGLGQVWHNVTGSRSLGVTYYNATTQPMQVHITTNSTDISHIGTLTVGGVLVGRATQPTGGMAIIHAAVIPPGASYVVAQNGPGASISNWAELY